MRLASDIRIVNVVSTAELVLFEDGNIPAAFRATQTAELLFDGNDMSADLAQARTAEMILFDERNMPADLNETRSSKLIAPINLHAISDNLLKNIRIDSVKYKPDKFIAAILKQTCPIKSTCLLFESGKFVCLGMSYLLRSIFSSA